MRVARYFPMVVVTGLVCQTAIPFSARASDSAAIDMAEQSSEPQSKGRYVDGAVQQAGFLDSRPRSNSTMISQPDSGSNQQNRSLLTGDALGLPKTWFGRQVQTPTQTQNSRPTNKTPQSASNRSALNQSNPNNAGQMRPRVANQPVGPSR